MTPAGRERLGELHEVAQGMDAELRTVLTPDEVEVLGDVLMRLHHHFTDPPPDPRSECSSPTPAGEETP